MALNEATLRKLGKEELIKLPLEYQSKFDQMKLLERQCWVNKQYSRRECFEISGVPKSVSDKDLEGKVLNLFQKTDIEVHPDNIEACHWVRSNAGPKKVIIKMSRRKDAEKIRRAKKIVKGSDLPSIGIN